MSLAVAIILRCFSGWVFVVFFSKCPSMEEILYKSVWVCTHISVYEYTHTDVAQLVRGSS